MRSIDILCLSMICLGTGLLAGMSFSLQAIGILTALGITRLCWIDDNIHNDLLMSQEMPMGYRNAQVRRANWCLRAFGAAPEIEEDPLRLALRLKLHTNLILVFVVLMAASAITLYTGGLVMDAALILAALVFAFAKVDGSLAISGALQSEGRPQIASARLIGQVAARRLERTMMRAERAPHDRRS